MVHMHDITKSAGSQTNNKSSDQDSITAEFYKNVRILGNKKVLKKSQIGWRQMLEPSLPSRNKFFVIAVKNYTSTDFKVSWSCPILLDFFT